MTTQAEAQADNWQAANTWYEGLGLEYVGVQLGDCLAYSVLTVLGRIALAHLAEAQAAEVAEPANA